MWNVNKLLLLLLFLPLISANGLKLTSDTFLVNKTSGIDLNLSLTLTNEESFSFKNITFQNTNILTMNKISELSSGQNITFPVTITSNSDFNGNIRLIGSYDTNIGESNTTYNTLINNAGLDRCNVNLIEGDSMHWFNSLIGEVKLRNMDTGEYFQTIPTEGNYTLQFLNAVNFNYQVFKVGIPISQICNLNVQGKTGLVHNSNYDALVNLNLSILYEPTTIEVNFPTTNYSLRYDQETQDIFTIRNTGIKLAKNIRFSADWITFDKNNFDLGAGQSVNIGYTIRPNTFDTNKTNMTHVKTIQIQGNFPVLNKDINIFVQYFDFSFLSGGNINEELIDNFIKLRCQANPDKCPKTIVYLNDSDKNVTFNIGYEAYREGILQEDAFRQKTEQSLRALAEANANSMNNDNQSLSNTNQTAQDVRDLKNNFEDISKTQWFFIFCIGFIFVASGLTYLIFSQKSRNKVIAYGNYAQGEKIW